MPTFDAKRRSWEAYLAGIGASGALMASASVMFVILVGVVGGLGRTLSTDLQSLAGSH
jgi:hypothetical protein